MKKNRLVYTVILGDYDILQEVKYIAADIDYVCITDNVNVSSETWEVIHIDSGTDSVELNRLYKFLPMRFFNYHESMYLDGNIAITGDVSFLFDKYLSSSDIAISPHPFRSCLYDEASICVEIGKATSEQVNHQLYKYRNEGFPHNYGLFENNVIIRRHTEEIRYLMDMWLEEFKTHSKRDQLSLCYCLWKLSINCNKIYEGPRYSSKYLNFNLHKKELSLSPIKRLSLLANIRQKQSLLYCVLNKVFISIKKIVKS